jgi:hypothetical protein
VNDAASREDRTSNFEGIDSMSDTVQQQATGTPSNVTGGGPIPWFCVSLQIHAKDLDPDKITRLLGVEPDRAQRRGVPMPSRGDRPPRVPWIGMWSIDLRPQQAPGCPVETAISRVLDRITVPLDVWHRARAGAIVRIAIGLSLDEDNRGFGLEPALLRRAADFGIALDFDIYYGADDELGVAEPALP